jgi:WD40 repeat protein
MCTLHFANLQKFFILLLAVSLSGCNTSTAQTTLSTPAGDAINSAVPNEPTAVSTGSALPSNQELEPISSTNISRLSLLARFSEGEFGNDIALSPDGKTLAVAALGGIVLYNATNGDLLRFDATANAVDDLSFSPDGQEFAYVTRVPSGATYTSGDFTGTEILKPELTLRSTEMGTILFTTPLFGKGCGEYAARDISFTADGKYIVFLDTFTFQGLPQTDDLCVLNVQDGSLVRSIKQETPLQFTSLASSPSDSSSVWVSVLDTSTEMNGVPTAYLQGYDPINGTPENRFNVQNIGGIDQISSSPAGQWLAVGSRQQVQILSANDGSLAGTISSDQRQITAMALSADETVLALGYQDGSTQLYNIPQIQKIGEFKPVQSSSVNVTSEALPVLALRFSPDDTRLYRLLNSGVQNDSALVQAISLENNQQLFSLSGRNPFSRPVLSPDNSLLAWGGYEDGHVEVWTTHNDIPAFTLKGHSAMVLQTLFSPDGRQIATASNDGTVRLWKAEDGTALFTLDAHSAGVWAIAYSNAGNQLASIGRDGVLSLWDTSTGSLIKSFDSGTTGWQVNSLIFTQDGNAVLVVSGCLAVQLCSAQGAGDLRQIDLSDGRITTLLPYGIEALDLSQNQSSFSADSQQGKFTGQVSSGQFAISHSFTSPYGTGALAGATLSPNGSLFLSGNASGVHAWETTNGQMLSLAQDRNRTGYYGTMQFTGDAHIVWVASDDGVIYLWGVHSSQ